MTRTLASTGNIHVTNLNTWSPILIPDCRLKQVEEENERLSEQLAENVERPRAEGQEESPGNKVSWSQDLATFGHNCGKIC